MILEHLIAIESTPVDFAIFYKYAGINCEDEGIPCLVEARSGLLKPIAQPYLIHSRLRGSKRLAVDLQGCYGGSALAAVSLGNRSLSAQESSPSLQILLAGTDSNTVPPTQLHVEAWPAICSQPRSTLTTVSVTVNGSIGTLLERVVEGSFSASGIFQGAGEQQGYKLPIDVDANTNNFASLLTLTCGSQAESTAAAVEFV